MRLTRRAFLETSCAAAAALGLGVIGLNALKGRVFFNEERALPGMRLLLTLETNNPENCNVSIIARCEGRDRIMETRKGSASFEIEVPSIETDEETYELYALVENGLEQSVSVPVEVLSQPYHFGM